MATHAPARRRAAASPAPAPTAQRRPAAAGGMPAYLQRKLRLGQAGDAYEAEADRVADHIVRGQGADAATTAEAGVQRAEEKKEAADGGKKEGGDKKEGAGKKDAGGGKKDAAGGKGGAQAPKKDEVKRKEVSADEKVEKAKEKQAKKEEQKAKTEGKQEEKKEKQEAKQEKQEEKKDDKKSGGKAPEQVQAKAARPMISRLAAGTAQRKAMGGAGTVGADTERGIEQSRGGGQQLPEQTRAEMEGGFCEDFSGVRVHDDAAADGLARDLDARAFTVGNDIYFAQGAYAPHTSEGQHLLAHELTHVVQQGGGEAGVQRKLAQRAGKPKGGAGKVENDTYTGPEGEIPKDFKNGEITLPNVKLPKVKTGFGSPPFTLSPLRREDNPTEQSSHWKKATPSGDIGKLIDDLMAKSKAAKTIKSGKERVFLKVAGKDLVGTRNQVIAQLRNPKWNRSGADMSFQIDHQQEMQLGGADSDANVWLLEAATNQDAGRTINGQIRDAITKLIVAAQSAKLWKKQPDFDAVRYGPVVKITEPSYSIGPNGGAGMSYTKEDITGGKQLPKGKARAMTLDEIKKSGLDDGDKELVTIYTRPGGAARILALNKGQTTASVKKDFLPGLTDAQITVGGDSGSITGTVEIKKGKKAIPKDIPVDLGLNKMKGDDEENSYVIDQKELKKAFGDVSVEGWSPVDFVDIDFGPGGLVARGIVRIDVPIIKKGATAELTIGPDGLEVTGTIEAGAIEIPGPVQITGGAFFLQIGEKGLGAGGSVNFEVEGLGAGTISAKVDASGPQLDGSFAGESDMFSTFDIDVHYNREKGFWGSGSIEVAKKKIPGVDAGSATVSVEGKEWNASGTITPSVKLLKSVSISAKHVDGQGFTFTGKAELGDMPVVSGGEVTVVLAQVGGAWKVSASGHLDLAAPGLDSAKATVSYNDGVFTAEVGVGYKKGKLSGTVTVGVSNQPPPMPAAASAGGGAPAAPPAAPAGGGDALTFYGKGSVEIQITPWLKGTVGIVFAPNGDVTVSGEVALAEIELVPEKKFEKELLSIGIDIPIVGVSFAGQRVGIFATVGGNVKFDAGIGPVKLRNTKLAVNYSPQHEDQTTVSGTAQVHCPAHAGLRVAINGGVGAGIPIVSATVGLELGGTVGIKGEATLDVNVDWGANKPFSFSTEGKLSVQPTIKIDLAAFAKVEADLLIDTITLYEERWNLAGYEWGANQAFEVSFPVNYTEGKGLDLDLDKISVKAPDIDPIAMVKDMIG